MCIHILCEIQSLRVDMSRNQTGPWQPAGASAKTPVTGFLDSWKPGIIDCYFFLSCYDMGGSTQFIIGFVAAT